MADETCFEALLEEKSRCESTDCVETVSFNAGWQTHGSGSQTDARPVGFATGLMMVLQNNTIVAKVGTSLLKQWNLIWQ